MKHIVLPLLLLSFASLIAAGFIYHKSSKERRPMRVALSFGENSASLDPAKILNTYQYEILRNLYGRLVRYDSQTQLVADVPESFIVTDDEIVFDFGNKVTTVDGHKISATDAALSLKRLIAQGGSGHGDIRKFLCPGVKLSSLKDNCPGIRVEGNRLILKAVTGDLIPLLLPALESADYSIIPGQSLNEETGELLDKSHRNTSGPYYVESEAVKGLITLKANPRSHLYHPDMPQTVQLVAKGGKEAVEMFGRGELDLLPSTFYFTRDLGEQVLTGDKYTVHETLPLRVLLVRFSAEGLKKFTPEQRLFAGKRVGEIFREIYGIPGAQPTHQFFQALSDGSLNADQEEAVNEFRNSGNNPEFSAPIKFGVSQWMYDTLKSHFDNIPQIELVMNTKAAVLMPVAERPEMYVVTTDSAWTENLSLIGYNFEVGAFSLPGLSPEKWFEDYISTSDKQDRIQKLNRLHFDVLRNASIIPIEVSSYYVVSQKGWQLNQSKLSAGTELWPIRRH